MAIPSLEKNYEFDLNRHVGVVGGQHNAYRECYFNMKQAWINWTAGAATVWGSSDKTNWSNTGTDYWVDQYDLLTGSPGSWIVLNMYGGGQLLMALGSSYDHGYIQYSPAGLYTGGGATTLPTAADAYTWSNNADWWFDAGSTERDGRLHCIHSTDGDVELVFLADAGIIKCAMIFVRPQDPVSGWTANHVAWCVSYSAGGRLTNAYLGQSTDNFEFRQGGAWRDGFLSTASMNREAITERTELSIQSWTGKVPMSPCGFASIIAGAKGRHGRIPDLYYVHDTLSNGDTIEDNPSSPTREWCVFESLAVPWDGSVPLMA